MLTPWLVGVLLLAAADDEPFLQNVRETEPLTAVQQASMFHVPPGFEVQLVAAEPEIPKPMNLAFDSQGRLWVSGSIEYPYAAEEGAGRDSIKVLEDTNNDGRADRITTFAEGLNIPIGLYPYRDGVVAYSIDRIEFWRDTNGDGVSDRRELLFGPLGRPRDTHGMQNAFRRGLDGWLYVNHGFANETTIRGSDGSQIQLRSGNTYRIRLDGSRVEQFTWGQVNPFGSAWTEMGDLITADCHSKPLTLLLRGAYYTSFGKPHDGLGFAPELMSHHHGSTGLAGVAYYDDGPWPAEYRDNVMVGNVVTSRVHRDRLVFHGGTARAEELPDFLTCDDPWFRPVDLRFGPDGALYIADFYNRIIGHYEVPLDHPGRDRQRGRIWRVVYRPDSAVSDASTAVDLSRASLVSLIDTLEHPTLARRLVAVDQLSDRYGMSAAAALRQASLAPDTSPTTWRRRALSRWVLLRLGCLDDADLQVAASDTSALARKHAMRMLAELPQLSPAALELISKGLVDQDANVRRDAADACGQHPRSSLVRPLLDQLERTDAEDVALRHALRLALRNQLRDPLVLQNLARSSWSDKQRQELADVALAVNSMESGRFVLDFLLETSTPPEPLGDVLQHVARNLPADGVGQMIAIARKHTSSDLALAVSLFQTIRQALKPDAQASAVQLQQWAHELVDQLIDRINSAAFNWIVRSGDNPWGLERRERADGVGDLFLSSLPGGEQAVSRLVSRPLSLPPRLTFWLCGHRGDPQSLETPPGDRLTSLDQEVPVDAYVQLRLISSNRVVRRAFPPRSDRSERIEWDLQPWQGQSAVLELVDNLDAPAYAWLAVSHFDPDVAKLPSASPREIAEWQRFAAQLMLDVPQSAQQDLLQEWVQHGVDWSSQSEAAVTLATLRQQPGWQVLARQINNAALNPALRRAIADDFVQQEDDAERKLFEQVFQNLSQPQQEAVAQQLVTTAAGAQLLLTLIEQGNASGQLLRRLMMRESLRAIPIDSLQTRVERIVAALPPEDDRLKATIDATRAAFRSSDESIANGKALYVKHCSACHRVRDEGHLVGPQLDGIGNRGLDRVSEDVLAPYRNVDVAFRTTILSMDDGRVLAGLVRQKDDDRWILVDTEGKELVVTPNQIEQQHVSPLSIMPDNFWQLLNNAERNDLLAFLLSQRGE